jgi:fatty-acyl-CoA synthase
VPDLCYNGLRRLGLVGRGEHPHQTQPPFFSPGWLIWVIKPKGYLVYPAQVEDHLCELRDQVAVAGVVGVDHDVWVEAIVAFVEKKPGAELTVADLEAHAMGIASYMRPSHYVILEPGGLPLNRVAKTDYVTLHARAKEEVARLRAEGSWDR